MDKLQTDMNKNGSDAETHGEDTPVSILQLAQENAAAEPALTVSSSDHSKAATSPDTPAAPEAAAVQQEEVHPSAATAKGLKPHA